MNEVFICPVCRYDHETGEIVSPMPEVPVMSKDFAKTINQSRDCQHLWGMAEEEYREHNHTILLKLICSHCDDVMYPNHLPRDIPDDGLPW